MTQFPLEAGLTTALWDLFAAEGPVKGGLDALYCQLPDQDLQVEQFKAKVDALGSQAWLTRFSPGPDLALVTSDDNSNVADVLAIIEVKAAAKPNWPGLAAAEPLEVLPGEIAALIVRDYFGDSRRNPADPNMCQIDLYRSRKWWKSDESLRDDHGVRFRDPDDVLWLFFDTRGRTTADAFPGASTPLPWIPIDLKKFAADLREMRRDTKMTDAHRDTIAVVLWHIDQAPGTNRHVPESPAPRDSAAPSVDEIPQDDDGDFERAD